MDKDINGLCNDNKCRHQCQVLGYDCNNGINISHFMSDAVNKILYVVMSNNIHFGVVELVVYFAMQRPRTFQTCRTQYRFIFHSY